MPNNDRSGAAPESDPRITEDSVRRFLIEQIARRSRITAAEVDPDRPVEEFGLASRDAVAIAGELEQMLGRALPATLIWEHPTINGLAAALAGTAPAPAAPAPRSGPAPDDEPIAVIGIGCRFPGGERGDLRGPQEFWRFLLEGGDAIGELPPGRWDPFDDGSPEVGDLLARTTRLGGFLKDLAAFDARFFGITPGEAELMDPQQRLVLEVAWEAFEHAGLAPVRLRGSRTGVFVGVSAPEYAALTASDLTAVQPHTTTGAALSIIAGRLSYLLDLRGPSMIVDTACSSSLVSTHLAVQALRSGEADLALAAGVNVLLSPTVTMTFDQGGGTSPDGRCKAFDASADGMVRAEGCGAVVLKRLGDARRDGDRILAVIRGSGVNSDGRSNGLVAPNAEAQKALLRRVYEAAGIDPREVDYVEAHGTGTFLGDPIEARALGEVLGRGREEDEPLLIGSVKSNVGHMESAAGIAGLIKTVLALHHRTIPASLHFTEPNPHIPFRELRLAVAAEPSPWPDRGRPPRAGVSGFGFGGTNAHVIVEAAPPQRPARDDAPVRSFPLSDVAHDRIPAHAADLAGWLEEHDEVHLADLAATLHRRDGRGRARAAVVARDREGLLEGLRALADGRPHPAVATGTALGEPRRPVWVFSGYGAQWPGMAWRLLQEETAFTEAIDDVDALMSEEAGFSLWDAVEAGEALPPERTMMALFGIQIGLARMWASYGIVPAAVVGHSMGEVAAAVVAGRLTLADGVKVICRRSELLGRLVGAGGSMAVIGGSEAEVRRLAHDLPDVHPAVFSSPKQTVVTGDAEQIAAVLKRAEAEGRLARAVRAEAAGHSPATEPLLPELREALADVAAEPGTPLAPGIEFYSTALEDPRGAGRLDADYWALNLRNPVRLTDALSAAADDGHRTFVEINVHPILTAALNETLEGTGALIVHTLKRPPKGREADDTLSFHTQLAALAVNGHRVAAPAGALLELPPARWRHERYWARPSARTAVGRDEHPLLGAHVELPGEDRHAWRGDVGVAAHPWIAENAPHDLPVLPVAALAEMALSAAGRALGADGLRLHGLCVRHLLALEERTAVTTTFTEDDRRIEIHARTPAGTFVRIAEAEAVEEPGRAGTAPDGEEVEIPAAERGSPHYRLHPQVLDRCLAALCRRAAAEDGGVWIVDGIEDLRVHGPTHRGGRCRLSIARGETVTGALVLTDADGAVLLEAAGVALRRVERHDVPVPLADTLVEQVWETTDAPAPTVPEGDWLVLADADDPLAGGLEAGLRARGHRVARRPLARRLPEDLSGDAPTGVVLIPPPSLEDEELVLTVAGVAREVPAGARLWVATRAALPVRDGEAGRPRQGFVRALTRVLGFERAALKATLVDVEGADDLVTELLGGRDDTEVAWRRGVRRVARLDRAALPDRRPRRVVRRGGAYVITGGYGGIGLVTARLLAERGAGRIVLSGRSGPGPDAEKTIARLRESGVDVDVVLGDIAEPGVAERLIEAAREGGARLRGVVHGAAGMDDRLLADLGPEDLHRVWAPKVAGAWRLHEALQAAGADAELDFFVLHSSAAALLGSPGQASYAAANAALDALAAWRRAQGLVATTVQWGTWSRVGGAADLSIKVLDPISPQEGAEALEALLAHDRAVTGVLRFDPATAVALFPEIKRMPYFAALVEAAAAADEGDDGDWPGVAALRAMDPDEARAAIGARVRRRIASVLGYDPDRLDPAVPLTDLGLDSLVAVRIKSGVEHDLGLTVPPALLLQGATLEAFADWAAGELGIAGGARRAASDTGSNAGSDTGSNAAVTAANARSGYVMPRDAAERLAVRIFEDVLGLERVSVTADFFALGGDERRADRVVAVVNRELGCELTRGEVFAVPTAEHVAGLIRAVDEEAARQTVRPLQPGAPGRRPLFLAHPAGGTTACYARLAALLGEDQPVYGLERFDDAPSVEERAARYVEALLEAQPEGAFRLGGWSFGGVLAYETARRLTEAGREVELVVLLDAGLPEKVADEADVLARRFAAFADYLNETYGLGVELRYEELAGLSEEEQFALVMERAAGLAELLPPAVLHHQLTSHQDTRSLEAYRPRPYSGRVILYRAPEETPWAVKDIRYAPDPTNRFGEHCAHLEIVEIPGAHHLNLLDPPAVDRIAAHLSEQLAADPSA